MQISYEKLEEILSSQSTLLIVRGEASYSLSGLEIFLKKFNKINKTYYWIVKSKDPDSKEIEDLSSLITRIKPSLILSCGGGTVIDTTKAASFLSRQTLDLVSLLEGKRMQDSEKVEEVAIPTTCGTGSESTHFAVIYKDRVKYSLADKSMKPNYFYLDGSFLAKLPPKHILSSSLDAFSQSIESFWAKSSTRESRLMSVEGMRLFSENYNSLLTVDNVNQLNLMLTCANKAGQAINITKTTAPHAISYYLSKKLNLPHGFSVFLTLPEIFQFTLSEIITNGDKLDVEIIYKSMMCKNFDDAFFLLREVRKQAAVYMDIPSLNSQEIEELSLEASESVNQERLSNHPVELDKKTISELTHAGLKEVFL
jgi:alcohol dehydrogenase class IV